MAMTSHTFLASLLFLCLAITGLNSFADARLAEWRAPIEPISTPLNLSGNSVGQLFQYSRVPSPNVVSPMNLSGGYAAPVDSPFNLSGGYVAPVDSPFNLSGGYSVGQLFEYHKGPSPMVDSPLNLSGGYAAPADSPFNLSGGYAAPVDSPFNLSGGYAAPVDSPFNLSGGYVAPLNFSENSVGRRFEYSRVRSPSVASPLNLSGNSAGQQVEVLTEKNFGKASGGHGASQPPLSAPGFAVINSLAQVIMVTCYNDALKPPSQLEVLQEVAPGQEYSWDLDTIDPKNPHVLYKCSWMVEHTERVISHEAWVDVENRNRLPFYCEFCTWKVSGDGLYLLDPNWKTWTKVSNWSGSPRKW